MKFAMRRSGVRFPSDSPRLHHRNYRESRDTREAWEGRSPSPLARRNKALLGNAQSLVYTKSAGWADTCEGVLAMCDYSLHGVRSRPAKISDKLVTKDFGTGTRGFASVTD